MNCKKCGFENDEGARFCENCGSLLARVCSSCGSPLKQESRFCKDCGTPAAFPPTSKYDKDRLSIDRLASLQQSAPLELQERIRSISRNIEGERKPVTILFTDIVGSTSLAERLDPEEWAEIVSGAHQRVSQAVYHYEGTIAQLLGDGVLAFFGAPITHEDDPIRAVNAALDIQYSIENYAHDLRRYAEDFQMRVGLNTGTVVVGSVGSDMHLEYLALGDAVNLAARLQSSAKPGTVLISESTARLVKAAFNLNCLGEISLKGKADAVVPYEVIQARAVPESTRGFEELYEMGLIDRLPKIAVIQVEGCAPMVTAFKAGKETPDIVTEPNTHIATLATGNPGMAYGQLRQIILKHGGAMESVSDQESFRAMHVLAKMDGFSVEPATAAAFAGLFKLIGQQVIKRDEIVVVNCSGHTFPVEKELLGDEWARDVEVPQPTSSASVPQEGLLSALERLDDRMRDVLIMDDTPEASRLLRRILQAYGSFNVREAENGRIGLDMVYQRPPDLILLDLMMPEMDGFAVLDALKTDKELSKIPVIVVTAKELTAIEKQRLSGKVQSLLQKGAFSNQDIIDKMMEMLN